MDIHEEFEHYEPQLKKVIEDIEALDSNTEKSSWTIFQEFIRNLSYNSRFKENLMMTLMDDSEDRGQLHEMVKEFFDIFCVEGYYITNLKYRDFSGVEVDVKYNQELDND